MKPIFKHVLLAGLCLGMAACATKPDTAPSPNPEAEETVTESTPQVADPNVKNGQALLASMNLYQQAKKPLTDETKALLGKAQDAVQSGERVDAAGLLARLMAHPQRTATMYVLQGDYALQTGEADKAQDFYRQAVNANPYTYFAHNRIATLLRAKGLFDEALMHYNRALDGWAGYAPAYRNRGILYDLYLGDKAKAKADYERYRDIQLAKQDDFASTSEGREINAWIADLSRQMAQTGGR
ncbi:tetratricopeptide repeat protein [Alteromonas sp. H39]|uniref:tetratricopeptide repeat protein n=1 Tax=Alteromonas sp. H39 TaxID=3389876 RepID=UPI0039E12913